MARLALLLQVVALVLGANAAGGKSETADEISRLNNQSLLWGPYKPNLYFGVRPRVPHGLWTGLMWSKVDDYVDARDGKVSLCFVDLLLQRLMSNS